MEDCTKADLNEEQAPVEKPPSKAPRLGPPGARLAPSKKTRKPRKKPVSFIVYQKNFNDAITVDVQKLIAQVAELRSSNKMQREVLLGLQVIVDELSRKACIGATEKRALFQQAIDMAKSKEAEKGEKEGELHTKEHQLHIG